MPADNPFQLIYNELWTMMEEDERFTIKEGNKIKFNANKREPLKTQHTTSDYPEVALFPESGVGNISSTSSTSNVTKRYTWVISTGDYRYDEISDIEFALYAGLTSWLYRMKPLLWKGVEFVKRINIVATDLEFIDRTIARARTQGIQGLISIFSIEVECHFANEILRGPHLDT
jgi:hypothetical protein